jgi:hypothetical protein
MLARFLGGCIGLLKRSTILRRLGLFRVFETGMLLDRLNQADSAKKTQADQSPCGTLAEAQPEEPCEKCRNGRHNDARNRLGSHASTA